jgi:hypothetical protein
VWKKKDFFSGKVFVFALNRKKFNLASAAKSTNKHLLWISREETDCDDKYKWYQSFSTLSSSLHLKIEFLHVPTKELPVLTLSKSDHMRVDILSIKTLVKVYLF